MSKKANYQKPKRNKKYNPDKVFIPNQTIGKANEQQSSSVKVNLKAPSRPKHDSIRETIEEQDDQKEPKSRKTVSPKKETKNSMKKIIVGSLLFILTVSVIISGMSMLPTSL